MDALQQIIQSLTPPEKRYFKLFANAFRQESDLLKLFDVLDTDKEETDAVIKKKTGIKNLPIARSNLRKLILKSMRIYSEETSQTMQARAMMSEMEWLGQRGLIEESLKEMRKAEKFSIELELYHFLFESAPVARFVINSTAKDPEAFTQAYEELMENISRYGRLSADYNNAMVFNSYVAKYANIAATNESSKANERTDEILRKAIIRLENTETIRGKILMLLTIAGIYTGQQKADEAYKVYNQVNEIYDRNPFVKENPLMLYLAALNNYCNACKDINESIWQQSIERFISEFNLLAKNKVGNESKWKMLSVIMYQRLRYAQVTLSNHFIKEIDADMLALLQNYERSNMPEAVIGSLLHYISYSIQIADYSNAIDWLNHFYQHKQAKQGRGIYLIARLLEVIIFYEQKDFDIADTKATNLYKTLVDLPDDMKGDHQAVLGNLLRKLSKWQLNLPADVAEANQIADALQEMFAAGNNFVTNLHEYFNLAEWLRHKFKNRKGK